MELCIDAFYSITYRIILSTNYTLFIKIDFSILQEDFRRQKCFLCSIIRLSFVANYLFFTSSSRRNLSKIMIYGGPYRSPLRRDSRTPFLPSYSYSYEFKSNISESLPNSGSIQANKELPFIILKCEEFKILRSFYVQFVFVLQPLQLSAIKVIVFVNF